jgi:heme-degrading monooxygenase HmoA
MQARTSTWSGSPEVIERWTAHVTRDVMPMVAGLPGNAGAYFFVDRQNQRAMTLTLWDDEAAAAASDEMADASRARTVAATGVTLEARGAYDVLTSD